VWNHGYDTLLAQTKLHEAKVLTAAKMRVTLHEEKHGAIILGRFRRKYFIIPSVLQTTRGHELDSRSSSLG
jgi:hypothetical protein